MEATANFRYRTSNGDDQDALSVVVRLNCAEWATLPEAHLVAATAPPDLQEPFTISLRSTGGEGLVLKRVSVVSSCSKLHLSVNGGAETDVAGRRMEDEDAGDAAPAVYEAEHVWGTSAAQSPVDVLRLAFPRSPGQEPLRVFVIDVEAGPQQKTAFGATDNLARAMLPLLAGMKSPQGIQPPADAALVEKLTQAFERVLDARLAAFEARIDRRFTELLSKLEARDAKQVSDQPSWMSGSSSRPSWIPPGVGAVTDGPASASSGPGYPAFAPRSFSYDLPYGRYESAPRMPGEKPSEVQEMNQLCFL
ncbi:hypothetical protein DFJ74DRAFT_126665 [Hyaloraphidium curvatum]|nr:hypothetical protein DFJ74DRAFT_126665 [Hyaloraphidium curvatum]